MKQKVKVLGNKLPEQVINVGRSQTPITLPWTEIRKSGSGSGKSGFPEKNSWKSGFSVTGSRFPDLRPWQCDGGRRPTYIYHLLFWQFISQDFNFLLHTIIYLGSLFPQTIPLTGYIGLGYFRLGLVGWSKNP